MHAEVLKRVSADDPTATASVRTIQHEAERLADMLQAAMQVIALERGTTRRVSLRSVVEDACAEAGVNDLVVTDGQWPEVMGDPRLMAVAVAHLLRNAVEATESAKASKPPEVSVENCGEMVGLVVRDYGAGLRSTNPKVLIRLRASSKPGHRGLGLVTVERIARLHGGGMRFDAPGPGARVTLLLPSAFGA